MNLYLKHNFGFYSDFIIGFREMTKLLTFFLSS